MPSEADALISRIMAIPLPDGEYFLGSLAADVRAAIERRDAELKAATAWIPVTSDRWPEPWNADVLCWDEGDGAHVVGCLSGFRKPNRTEPVWIADINGEIINLKNVTHWMPLPALPSTERGNGDG